MERIRLQRPSCSLTQETVSIIEKETASLPEVFKVFVVKKLFKFLTIIMYSYVSVFILNIFA